MCYNSVFNFRGSSPEVVNRKTATRIRKFQRSLFDWTVRHNPALKLEERAECLVRTFEGCLNPASRILDIGGGCGFYAEPLKRRGHQVTVLDVVKPGFQKAPVVLYDPEKPFPFPDKSFDASILITMLHHVPKPEVVIREARRVTRHTLIVVEDLYHHALGRWWTEWRDRIYNFEFFGHPGQFKKGDEWVKFFSKEGFSLLEEKEIYTWLAGMRILNGSFIFEVPRP